MEDDLILDVVALELVVVDIEIRYHPVESLKSKLDVKNKRIQLWRSNIMAESCSPYLAGCLLNWASRLSEFSRMYRYLWSYCCLCVSITGVCVSLLLVSVCLYYWSYSGERKVVSGSWAARSFRGSIRATWTQHELEGVGPVENRLSTD